MGRVYRAEHETLGRTVALKVLTEAVASRPGFDQRFIREARAMAQIDHPRVVRCYDAGRADGQLFMALEFVAGGDASQLVGKGTELEQALAILRDSAEGLVAIEDAQLVHRDIKPANIFIDDDGRAKLADLGLARSSRGDDALTVPGLPIGTPSYMAPEQARGDEHIDIRADIYALGATLFCLLAGRPPFIGNNPIETITLACSQPAPTLASLRVQVPAEVENIIQQCLAKDPDQRFQHAHELVAALQHAMAIVGEQADRHVAEQQQGQLGPVPDRMKINHDLRVCVLSMMLLRRLSSRIVLMQVCHRRR